jgi:5-hydroxyisourate hydrolase
MATISSHLLNSVDGTHANGVKVTIYQINSSGEKKIFFETETDKEGRILKDFELSNKDCACEYEMVCKTADYFSEKKIVSEIIVKFKMEDPKKKYHLPIIISPNGYSIWWSK